MLSHSRRSAACPTPCTESLVSTPRTHKRSPAQFSIGGEVLPRGGAYFTKRNNQPKAPFGRQQFGGSMGGPIIRNRVFFFGALEKVREDRSIPVPDNLFNQLELLVNAERAGQLPPGLVNPHHPHAGPIPSRVLLYSIKSNVQLSNEHSLMARFARQYDDRDHTSATRTPATPAVQSSGNPTGSFPGSATPSRSSSGRVFCSESWSCSCLTGTVWNRSPLRCLRRSSTASGPSVGMFVQATSTARLARRDRVLSRHRARSRSQFRSRCLLSSHN